MGNYITTQGDMWDSISLRLYGTESQMHLLIDANLQYRSIVRFPANYVLTIPAVPRAQRVTFPSWRSRA